ncbi:MAG: DNA repair protein RadC [Bacteroidetes bacterium]|nr:DNA repair protein RadC [Bacteroidota bacterium]
MKKRRNENAHTPEPTFYRTTIKEWPRSERPREKLLQVGSQALSDAELLAILIRTGVKGITAVDIAKKLIAESRTLQTLAKLSPHELQRFGLGMSKAVTLAAAFELARRLSQQGSDTLTIHGPEDVVAFMSPLLRDLRQEEFWVVLLSSSNRVIDRKRITVGLLNSSLVHPRECYADALVQRAASVIFVHNHPSGNPEPSNDDIEITKQLSDAGKILGITLHDHVIIAGSLYTSLAQRNIV